MFSLVLIAGACIVGLWLYAHRCRRRYRDMFAIYEMCSRPLVAAGVRSSHKAEGEDRSHLPLGPQSHNERPNP